MKNLLFLLFLLFFLILGVQLSAQDISRIEPPNWWVGMSDPNVQLMIHGENVSSLEPEINYSGVELKNVQRTDNPNYLFLDLTIEPKTQDGDVSIKFKKGNKTILTQRWPLKKRRFSADKIQGFNTTDVLYLITPDRFANGITSNDNMPGLVEQKNRIFHGGRHGGDIQGIINNLDYILDMGFTAIWLNPLLENNMEQYSYHGYSTTDFYQVDRRYGTNEDYQGLCSEANKKGIKIIMDMIVNHCGSEHWWMKDMPAKDWINVWDNYQETSHRKTLIQDPYASIIDKKIFTDGWFVPTMPDLNQRNRLMANYLNQNSIWWIEYLGLSGIRMDTYPYPDMDYMAEWTEKVMAEYPHFNIVGEEWYEDPAIVSYWQKDKINSNGYTSELKSLMDFPLQATMIKALNAKEEWKSGWILLYEMMAKDFLYADASELVVFPDNHDMSRFYTQVNEDMDLFKMGLIYTLTTRGIPQLYYGTEILIKNPDSGEHGIIRADFPGGWAGDTVNAFTDIGLSEDQRHAKQFVKQLLNWRKCADAIHIGKLVHFIPQDGVYVYFRFTDDEKIMIILNKNEEDYTLDLGRFAEIIDNSNSFTDVLTGKTVSAVDGLKLPIKSGLILEVQKE